MTDKLGECYFSSTNMPTGANSADRIYTREQESSFLQKIPLMYIPTYNLTRVDMK
jgi:hypothetical protein